MTVDGWVGEEELKNAQLRSKYQECYSLFKFSQHQSLSIFFVSFLAVKLHIQRWTIAR